MAQVLLWGSGAEAAAGRGEAGDLVVEFVEPTGDVGVIDEPGFAP